MIDSIQLVEVVVLRNLVDGSKCHMTAMESGGVKVRMVPGVPRGMWTSAIARCVSEARTWAPGAGGGDVRVRG